MSPARPAVAPLTLLESADLLGRMRYVELAAFARLGRRARTVATAPLAVWLSGASLAHGFRAGLLEHHLPVSATLPGPEALTVSPGPGVDAALELLGPDDGAKAPERPERLSEAAGAPDLRPGRDAELVRALVEGLYPAMLAGYEHRLEVASPAADPPLVRTLGRLCHDLGAVAEHGRGLLDGLGDPPSVPSRPAGDALVERLSRHLAGGGPFGPFGQDRQHRVPAKPS